MQFIMGVGSEHIFHYVGRILGKNIIALFSFLSFFKKIIKGLGETNNKIPNCVVANTPNQDFPT